MSEKQIDHESGAGLQYGEARAPKGEFNPTVEGRLRGRSVGKVLVLPVPEWDARESHVRGFLSVQDELRGSARIEESSDEGFAEIRAALDESRELGQRVSQRIDALVGRSG